ncbi:MULTISPECIES: phage tail tape measure protein [unclassified Curtobacterium]|uniref:phage tail tape measure protein n=1 Tax=unclassified Curtobacterium TaxID=257496 RepID=UPI003A8067F0
MADRLVQVSIRAEVSNFLAGAAKVQAATEKTRTEAQKLEKQGAAFEKVGAGITTIGVAAAAAVALSVKSFADFDAQMSQVQSLSHATASEMDTLRNAALTMGQGIGFSATQVAEAETELVKAGIGVKDIMGGALKGALDLAAAGQINVAEATEIAATAMTQFNLKGKDLPHVADLLAAAADKSLGGVDELGMALKQSGLVANQFGLTIDETVGTLAEFAKSGLMGSDAGTSLKQMFLQLATPTKQATDAMKQYHINAYDAQGDFVGITALAGQLAAGFKDVDSASRDSALGIIFGSDAIRAANILLKDGASKNAEWISSVNSAGFAAAQAAGKTDNLNGDVKKLGAALETGLIKSGSTSNDVLRTMVQNVTGLVKAFDDAPPAVQGLAFGLTSLVAVTALAGGGFLQMVPKIAAAKAAMKDLNVTRGSLARGFAAGGVIAVGVAAVASGIANMGSEAQLSEAQLKKLNAAMTATGSKALNAQFVGGSSVGFDPISKQVTSAREALKALDDDALSINLSKFTDGLTFGIMHTSDTAKRFEAQFKQMGTTLATTAEGDFSAASAGFNSLVERMGGGEDTAKRLLDRMSPYKEELSALASAAGKTASEQDLLNLAQGKGKLAAQLAAESAQGQKEQLAELSGVASEANEDISKLADSIRNFGSTQLDVESTESAFQAAIDDATASLKENGTTLDLNTEKGRANASALRDIASQGIAATAAIAENGGTQEEAAGKMQTVRDQYIATAQSFGKTKDEAVAMADQLKLIPANVSTLFKEQGADNVTSKAKDIKSNVDRIPSAKETKLRGDIKDAKAKLADLQAKLSTVPKSKSTQLHAEVAAAKANVASLQAQLNGIQSKSITITTNQVTRATKENTVGIFKASGGYISGPGTGTSDSIPAMLSNGEYVIRAAAVQKYGVHTFDRINASRYATGGLVADATTANTRAKNRFKEKQQAQRKAQAAFNKRKTAANRARLQQAQRETLNARVQAQRAAAALARAKAAPTGADLGDRISFRSAVRDGSYDAASGVRDLYSMGQDAGKYTSRQRSTFLSIASKNEVAMLKLEKQSDRAADAVSKASDKLGDLKSSSTAMASSLQGKLSDVSFGNYRSGSSLQRALTTRASKLKQFQALLSTLQKNGLAPALLNEVASLGVDEGLPLAKSLTSMSKGELSAINSQYNSIGKTSTAIGNQVADANYGKLIDAAERQLSAANKNADKIAKAISDQSKSLQKLIGKALGLPGYSAGGYTGDYSTGQVAGLVHGREFVSNASATARFRPVLEAMNQGRDVTYMDPRRPLQAAPATTPHYTQQLNVQPMQHVDPNTMLTVLGREASRAFSGMVS